MTAELRRLAGVQASQRNHGRAHRVMAAQPHALATQHRVGATQPREQHNTAQWQHSRTRCSDATACCCVATAHGSDALELGSDASECGDVSTACDCGATTQCCVARRAERKARAACARSIIPGRRAISPIHPTRLTGKIRPSVRTVAGAHLRRGEDLEPVPQAGRAKVSDLRSLGSWRLRFALIRGGWEERCLCWHLRYNVGNEIAVGGSLGDRRLFTEASGKRSWNVARRSGPLGDRAEPLACGLIPH